MNLSIPNLILTVFLLWVTIQVNSSYETYLAYFFVLTVGILHGANDVALIQYITKSSSKSVVKYLLFYIGVVLVTSVLFFLIPLFALIVFVLVSCFHFGEQHFYKGVSTINWSTRLFFIAYGSFIFALIFYFNILDSATIINHLTGIQLKENYFLMFAVGTGVLLFISALLNRKQFSSQVDVKKEIFILLVLSVIFKLATLLWAFAIYFIVWHSIPSLLDQASKLYGNLSKQSLLKYVKASVPTWLVSVIGLGIIYYLSTLFEVNFKALFFAFLAAITIPHVIVMFYLNK